MTEEDRILRSRAYYFANREKCRASNRRYLASHKDQRREQQRKYRLANSSRIKEYAKVYRAENGDKIRENNRKTQFLRHIKYKYGMSSHQFQDLMVKQKGKCRICDAKLGGKIRIHIDHCHKAGHVRGLLCRSCNFAVGALKNREDLAIRAADYLAGQILFNGS